MPHQSTVTSKKMDAKPHKIMDLPPAETGEYAESNEERFRKIADAAYFIALERGFDGGDPVSDWLVAEAVIDGKAFSLAGHGFAAS
jgi:hypothetical protein